MPLPTPKHPPQRTPPTPTPPEPPPTAMVKEPTAPPVQASEITLPLPPWTRQFDATWTVLGHALKVHCGVELGRVATEGRKQDWWVVGGDVARGMMAITRKDWVALALAVELLLRDLGIEATAEQLRGISRALAATADTLSLNEPAPPSPPPSVDTPEKTK